MRDRGLRNVTACNYFQLCDYECNYIVLLCFDYAVIILYCFVVTVRKSEYKLNSFVTKQKQTDKSEQY